MKALIVLAFAALAGAVHAADAPAKDPELKIATIDGKEFDLAAQKGHWVIVNYWATWCSPCIKELPEISKFVQEHKNVRAIGLAYEDTDKAEIVAFLKAHPVVFPIAQVDTFDPPKAFETPRGLPTTYIIDPAGKIAQKFTGPVDEAALRKAIPEK
ncbi:MAG TPA: TlpA disulfide reductase family protein [Tahibacter sp.]|nr:TlpA disulfide reductase family protein [Tahibacter sp.]